MGDRPRTWRVAVVKLRLQAEKPFVPGDSTKLQGFRRDDVETVMGVRRGVVVCPCLVGEEDKFTMTYNVRDGRCFDWGGARKSRALFREVI